ncbi:MAG: efflux RND transporter periplasmic adaptor subunit [Deltaproteobacteria bacterium]|nr:efflux RND transporter periplasmic adaptor subunit [Deltaproteobacteria bacterium]
MKKIIILLLIIALLGSAAMLLKKRRQSIENAATPAPLIYHVKVVPATTQRLEQTRPFLARLASRETAGISSKLSGRIKAVLVRENQSVKEGDLLLKIDDLEIASSIRSLQVSLKAQEKDVQYTGSLHERNRALFEVGGLAREKFEASEAAYAAKQASLEATRQKITALGAQLSYLNIKAPFDGTVGTIFSRKGDLANPGRPLLSINSPGQKLTFSYVPMDFAIRTGQAVFLSGRLIGRVITLYSDAANGLSVAEVDVDIPLDLPNNSYITIDVLIFADTGCTVPLDALLRKKEGVQVMVYENGAFTSFPVSVIAENKEHALIEPCPTSLVAVAAEAKLSQLPSYGNVLIHRSDAHE